MTRKQFIKSHHNAFRAGGDWDLNGFPRAIWLSRESGISHVSAAASSPVAEDDPAARRAVLGACRRLALAERLRLSAERMLAEAQSRAGHRPNGPKNCLTSTPPIRVVVYSDQPMLISSLRRLIAADPQLELAACCTTVAELKQRLAKQISDVAVIDFTPEITWGTLFELEKLAAQSKLILWAESLEGDLVLQALSIGIRGILRKSLPRELYRQCLHRVHAGDLWFERRMSDTIQ